MNLDTWRPYIAKILGPIIGAILSTFILWLKARWNIEVKLSDLDLANLVNQVINLVIFAVSTGISAVTINKAVNPGNAASSHLAAEEKAESAQLKDIQTTAERKQ